MEQKKKKLVLDWRTKPLPERGESLAGFSLSSPRRDYQKQIFAVK